MIQVLLKSDENKESYVCLNIPEFLFKEAAILDIHGLYDVIKPQLNMHDPH